METLVRQWRILTILPVGPRKVSTAEIKSKLEAAGIRTTQRTVQRDLILLSTIFPITCDGHTRPYGWCWIRNAGHLGAFPAEVRAMATSVPVRAAATAA